MDQYNIKVCIYYININIYLYLHAHLCKMNVLEWFVIIFYVFDAGSRAYAWKEHKYSWEPSDTTYKLLTTFYILVLASLYRIFSYVLNF